MHVATPPSDDDDESDNTSTTDDDAMTGFFVPQNLQLREAITFNDDDMNKVCAQVLSAPLQASYPLGTMAVNNNSLASSSPFPLGETDLDDLVDSSVAVSIPFVNVFVSRALLQQNFTGAAYAIAAGTLAPLDAHITSGTETDIVLPFAYQSNDYTKCYGGDSSCSGTYATTVASASAYVLLLVRREFVNTAVAFIGCGCVGVDSFFDEHCSDRRCDCSNSGC